MVLTLPDFVAIASGAPSFEKDVRPILKAHCFHCHGEDGEFKGELDVRGQRFLLKGGNFGPAFVAGKPAESHLLEVLKSGEMPKEKPKLFGFNAKTLTYKRNGAPQSLIQNDQARIVSELLA